MSKNAVLTQIWGAKCTYLLIYYFKWANLLQPSALQIFQLLQLNWFEKRSIVELRQPPDTGPDKSVNLELDFA